MIYSCSAFIWQDNIPPACATQVVTLRLSFHIYPTKLHTICGHNRMMHDEHVSIPRNDIRTISRNTRRDHEYSILHLSDDYTYLLLTNKQYKHIIRHLSAHITYFLSAENTSHDGHIYLDPTDELTYQLWANTQDTIRPSIRIYMMRSLTHCGRKYEDAEWARHARSIREDHALPMAKNTTRHHKLPFLHLLN